MSAHLSPQEQVYLISRKLALGNAPRPLAQLFAHLAECAACQEAVTKLHNQALSLPGTNELNTNAPDTHEWQPAHLDYERLAGYVANNLESVEREIADNHLAVCEFCAQEMQELTALQHALANELPASRPARPVAWWKHFRMLWPKLVFERLGAPAFAFGMLLLLGGLGGWWWQRRLTETDMARQSNSTPAEINPTATAVAEAKPTSNPQPPAPLVALRDHGQPIDLAQDGSLETALALPTVYRELLAATLAQQKLSFPATLKALAQTARTLKGGEPASQSFAVRSPVGVVLQSARPVFRWQAVTGASAYTVAIFDEDFNPVQTSARLTQTNWRAVQPLPRGRVLLWQVTAQVGDRQISAPAAPAPEARFFILAQIQVTELQQAQRDLAPSHLLLGSLYAQAGLVEDAARELQALQAENPQAPVVQKLLQQIRQPH